MNALKRTVCSLLPRLPLLLLALAAGAGAQAMTLREFHTLEAKEKKEGKAYASYYLVGVLEGLREANDTTRRTGQKPLFCIDGRRLEPSMARSLFQAELKRNAEVYEADMPVQLVLSTALQTSFKCAS